MTARELALRALRAYRRENIWPDTALRSLMAKFSVPQREAALAMQITGGVMQNMALCDFYTAHYSSLALKKIEPGVLDVLRLSIYQIVFLTKIPHSAAVNEGVGLVRKHSGTQAAGFTNAILRRVAYDSANRALPEVTGGTEQRLSVLYSHPQWLVHELCAVLGEPGAEKLLLKHNETDIPVTAQVNTLLADAGSVISQLVDEGVNALRHEWLEDCIELRGAGAVNRLKAFRRGCFYVQDAAARLAVAAAGIKPHDVVIDGCAAPGGKSFTAAMIMKNNGKIEAFDVSGSKLRLIMDGAARLRIGIINAVEKDAVSDPGEYAGKADVVLADVPCSGFGVIRKKPEIRYKTSDDIAQLPDIQKKILSSLAAYVRPGGVLLYSTCTFLRSENEDVIKWFLDRNTCFSAEEFTLPGIGSVPDGMITLWPHIHGTDGFFIARLRRDAA